MSLETASTEPQFFGKNSFVPFIGTVEDVDDPKRSNRVKVRIIGWHTDDKNELPTEDLPWAKVCMPTTHAQQSGIGGKHGMLPGCWVIGFFMDGDSAQDPYVINTFNFTSKVLEKNNRKATDTSEGKIPKDSPAFAKIIDSQWPNSGRATEEEAKATVPSDKSDTGRDSVLDASTDGECPTNKSQAEKLRTEEPKSLGEKGNAESQNYKIGLADGVCGGIAGAREEIQNFIAELFPPEVSRFAYGDLIWNTYTTQFINLNGNLLKIAQLACSLLKFSIHTIKAFQEDTIQRPAKSLSIISIPDRDGLIREAADFASSVLSDNFNASIDKIIDSLCMIILGILQEINNTTEEDNRQQSDSVSGGDNRNNRDQKGNVGAKTSTKINDASALCITDELLFTLDAEINKKISDIVLETTAKSNKINSDLNGYSQSIADTNTLVFRCDTDMNKVNDMMVAQIDSLKSKNYNPDPGVPFDLGGGGFGDIGSILGDSAQYVQLVLSLKFILFPQVFNKAGIQVLDEINQVFECISSTTRMFDTAVGKLGSLAGVDFNQGLSGGGSKSGKSSKRVSEVKNNIGLGGSPISSQTKRPGEEVVLCEDAFTKKVKDKTKKRKLIKEWAPVDFHERGRAYDLKGEVKFGNKRTSGSRVLVNDQEDPTENGIYVTSARKWKRAEDADKSKDLVKYKVVKVKNKGKRNRWWVYVKRTNPRLGKHEILFEPLYKTQKKPPKDILDLIKDKDIDDIAEVIDEDAKTKPTGKNADPILIGLPSDDPDDADNFVNGIPNMVVIKDPGDGYFNDEDDLDVDSDFEKINSNTYPQNEFKFPSVFIDGYNGTPIPVVNPEDGEIVSILINSRSFTEKSKRISVIKDNSDIGIRSDDENYDIVLCGIFVSSTGQSYTEDATIKVIDRDTGEENGKSKLVIVDSRIVDVEVINNGTRFKRIPKLVIEDSLGVGAKLYPFMCLRPRNPDSPSVKSITESVNLSFCVAKNQVNLIRPGRR